jgi:stage II sporulation protein D
VSRFGRHALVPLLIVTAAACATRPRVPELLPDETIRVQVTERGVAHLREVPLEEYAAVAALSEFAPAAGAPAAVAAMFEVQAVVARAYAVSHRGRHRNAGFDLCSTTHCQLYEPERLSTSRWAALARAAAASTAGLVLVSGGRPVDAVYHADCGGRTSAAREVWEGADPGYLRAQADDGAAAAAHSSWQFAVDGRALVRALDADPRTRVGGRLHAVTIVTRDGSGRAARILLRGARDVTVRGTDFREVLTSAFGARALRSTRFEVSSSAGRHVFSGTGFGHGVGLCQAGAFARVSAGAAPTAVLQRYYPGTTLVSAATLRPSSHTPPH